MFQIHFQGLLTHYLDNATKRRRAILYAVPAPHQHQPRLTVNPADVQPGSSLPDHPSVDPWCYDLSGNVTLSGIPSGTPVSFLGTDVLPNLGHLASGMPKNPRLEIVNNTPVPDVPVFVALEEGILFIHDYFEDMAIFSGATQRAMPRTVVYAALATGNVTVRVSATKQVILQKDAVVYLRNLPITPMPAGTSHYHEMSKFFAPPVPIVPDPATGSKCPYGVADASPTCGGGSAAGVECSNNQYP